MQCQSQFDPDAANMNRTREHSPGSEPAKPSKTPGHSFDADGVRQKEQKTGAFARLTFNESEENTMA
eukprot:11320605-Alexandrium_andersonii.AAC.1